MQMKAPEDENAGQCTHKQVSGSGSPISGLISKLPSAAMRREPAFDLMPMNGGRGPIADIRDP